MEEPNADVALLTPVPIEHLVSGLEVCAKHGFVTYGTDAGLTLTEFAHDIGTDSVADVLFYASGAPVSGVPRATYRARFVRYEGALPNGNASSTSSAYRPPSTASDGRWQGFYVVSDLRRLVEPVPLQMLSKRNAKGKLAKNFVPLGPVVIDTPF